MNLNPRQWIVTTGGPLLVLGKTNLLTWNGLGPDYECACAVTGYAGRIAVGPAEGLVLGDEAMPMCSRSTPQGVLLVRWSYGPDEVQVAAHVESFDVGLLADADEMSVNFMEREVRVFDAATKGSVSDHDVAVYFDLDVGAACVGVRTMEWRPDRETCLVIHWLRPM